MRDLVIAPCRRACRWSESGTLAGERLFSCTGCGSEWVPSQAWTPVDHTGAVPEPVRAARAGGEAR